MILSNEGNSLLVRQTEPEDAPILLRAYEDDSFIHLYRSNNVEQTEEELAELLAERAGSDPAEIGYVEFMIEHDQHGPVGVAALGDYSPLHQRAEYLIGIFGEQHRSIGYGTEATLLVLDLAFNAYHLHKVYSYIYEYNKFAQKNIVKFGFKHEGTLIEHHYLLREKRFVNLHINGMTEERFRNTEQIRRYSWRLAGRDVTQPRQIIKLTLDNQLPKETGTNFLEEWLA